MKFSELKEGMTDISPGILKRTLQAGPELWSEQVVPERARVKINYKIESEEEEVSGVVFDSSWPGFGRMSPCYKIGPGEEDLPKVRTILFLKPNYVILNLGSPDWHQDHEKG